MNPRERRILTAEGAEGGEGGAGAGGAEGGEGGAGAGAGGGDLGWRSDLPAEIQNDPSLVTISDVPTLAKSFLETKEHVGRIGIIPPKEGDVADLARFRKEIGVPETAEEYNLGDFKPPEGLPWSGDFQTAMLGKLHDIGIPNGQVRQILDGYTEVGGVQHAALELLKDQGYEQGTAKLKEELGANYDASTKLAERVFKAAAGEHADAISHLVLADGTHLGDNPAFTRLFIGIGKQYQEAGLHGEKVGGTGFTKTPDQAKQEIAELESHKALHDASHPEHQIIQDRMTELYKQAYPDEKPEVLT